MMLQTRLEEMQTWIYRTLATARGTEAAYQVVCDDYNNKIQDLKYGSDPREPEAATEEEKQAALAIAAPVLAVLRSGLTNCCMWVTDGQCQAHFSQLARAIGKALEQTRPKINPHDD